MVTATEIAVNQRNTRAPAYLCYLGAIATTRWLTSVERFDGRGMARLREYRRNDLMGSSWRCEMLYDGFTRSWRTSETQNTQLELIAGEPCVHAELKVVPIM